MKNKQENRDVTYLKVFLDFYVFAVILFLLTMLFVFPRAGKRHIDVNEIAQDHFFACYDIEKIVQSVKNGTFKEPVDGKGLGFFPGASNSLSLGYYPYSYLLYINSDDSSRSVQTFREKIPGKSSYFWNSDIDAVSTKLQGGPDAFLAFTIFVPLLLLLVIFLFTGCTCIALPSRDSRRLMRYFCYCSGITGGILTGTLFYFQPGSYSSALEQKLVRAWMVQEYQFFDDIFRDSTVQSGVLGVPSLRQSPASDEGFLYQDITPFRPWRVPFHGGRIFVAKPPFFPYAYIRVNLTPVTYLFYAPTMTHEELKRLNGEMNFTALEKGIWVGVYEYFQPLVQKCQKLWKIGIGIWCGVLVISCLYLLLKRHDAQDREA